MKQIWITASEIGDFVYCKRGWWIRFNGLDETNTAMRDGIGAHEKLAFLIKIRRKIILSGFVLIGIGILLLLAAVIYSLIHG